jgi:5-methylcytosine-specific restriction endonuclease McrA
LDRADSTLGYIPTNVVPCCKVCNRAKSDMTRSDFQAWLSQLVAHTNGEKV